MSVSNARTLPLGNPSGGHWFGGNSDSDIVGLPGGRILVGRDKFRWSSLLEFSAGAT
jgi:hypothetical protein